MSPTIDMDDLVWVDSKMNEFTDIKRFDIVLVAAHSDLNIETFYRVIGLPGENIRFDSGYFYVNDVPLIFPENLNFISYEVSLLAKDDFHGGINVLIPENAFYMIGDNVEKSYDSKHFGAIAKNLIIGRVLKVEKK